MATMTKRVNIRANIPVRNITPPIYGTYNDVIMSTGDILKCLVRHAIVEEILPDGTTVRLNIKNYFTDNGAGLYATKENKKSVVIKKVEDTIEKTIVKTNNTNDDTTDKETLVVADDIISSVEATNNSIKEYISEEESIEEIAQTGNEDRKVEENRQPRKKSKKK